MVVTSNVYSAAEPCVAEWVLSIGGAGRVLRGVSASHQLSENSSRRRRYIFVVGSAFAEIAPGRLLRSAEGR